MKNTLATAMILALGCVAASHASAVEVSPLGMTHAPSQRVGVLTVRNSATTPKTYQLSAESWTVVDGAQVRAPSQDIRFAPAVVTIAPGGAQTVRYAIRVDTSGVERAYRVEVREIVGPDAKPNEMGLILAMHMDFPYFWRAPDSAPVLAARWDGDTLVVKNSGTATAQLADLTAGAAVKQGLVGYVLPGEERRIRVEGGTGSTVSVRVNGKDQSLAVL